MGHHIQLSGEFGFIWYHGIRLWERGDGAGETESWRGFEAGTKKRLVASPALILAARNVLLCQMAGIYVILSSSC